MYRFYSKKAKILIIVCAIITAILFAWNFFPQSGVVNIYSDTADHANWSYQMMMGGKYPQKVNSYPLFFLLTGICGLLFNNIHYGITLSASIVGTATFLAQLYFINKTNIKSSLAVILLSFGLTFVWPIVLNFNWLMNSNQLWAIYLKSWSASPVHNLTSLAVRPLSLLIVSIFLDLFKTERTTKKLVALSVLLLISVLVKPSFYQYFVIAVAIYTIIYFFTRRDKKSFVDALYIALTLVPATVWVIYSMKFNLNSMIIYPFRNLVLNYGKDAWLCFSSLARGQMFCIAVFVYLLIKKKISKEMWFIYLCITIAFSEFVFLYEPEEYYAFNFAWGYMNATYIMFVYSAKEILCINSKQCFDNIWKTICIILLILHITTGIFAYINYADNYRNEYKMQKTIKVVHYSQLFLNIEV